MDGIELCTILFSCKLDIFILYYTGFNCHMYYQLLLYIVESFFRDKLLNDHIFVKLFFVKDVFIQMFYVNVHFVKDDILY